MTVLFLFFVHDLYAIHWKPNGVKFLDVQKRLEGLTEAELEALLEQVDEEKRRLGEKVN